MSPHNRPRVPQMGFLENSPFADLMSAGWHVTEVGSPRTRPGGTAQVRPVTMADQAGRAFTFDVDATNRMSEHATFCHRDHDDAVFVLTPAAAIAVAAVPADAPLSQVRSLPGTYSSDELRQHYRTTPCTA